RSRARDGSRNRPHRGGDGGSGDSGGGGGNGSDGDGGDGTLSIRPGAPHRLPSLDENPASSAATCAPLRSSAPSPSPGPRPRRPKPQWFQTRPRWSPRPALPPGPPGRTPRRAATRRPHRPPATLRTRPSAVCASVSPPFSVFPLPLLTHCRKVEGQTHFVVGPQHAENGRRVKAEIGHQNFRLQLPLEKTVLKGEHPFPRDGPG